MARDGIYYNPKVGRIVEHHGYSMRIHWSVSMLDYLRRHFPTTLNEELAGCLGVSQRTMARKARELGLQKDEAWLRKIWDERRRMAHAVSTRGGNAGTASILRRHGVRPRRSGLHAERIMPHIQFTTIKF